MGALSPWHIAILVVVMVLLFGAKRLPDSARSLGRSMRIFKSEMQEMGEDKKSGEKGSADQPQAPVVQQLPPVQQPVYQQPAPQQPLYQQPAPQQPVYQQPAPQQPVGEQQPSATQPVDQGPVVQPVTPPQQQSDAQRAG